MTLLGSQDEARVLGHAIGPLGAVHAEKHPLPLRVRPPADPEGTAEARLEQLLAHASLESLFEPVQAALPQDNGVVEPPLSLLQDVLDLTELPHLEPNVDSLLEETQLDDLLLGLLKGLLGLGLPLPGDILLLPDLILRLLARPDRGRPGYGVEQGELHHLLVQEKPGQKPCSLKGALLLAHGQQKVLFHAFSSDVASFIGQRMSRAQTAPMSPRPPAHFDLPCRVSRHGWDLQRKTAPVFLLDAFQLERYSRIMMVRSPHLPEPVPGSCIGTEEATGGTHERITPRFLPLQASDGRSGIRHAPHGHAPDPLVLL